MKLTLSIPDDLYEVYEQQASRLNGKAAAQDVILAQLDRFKTVHAADRIIVVESKDRDKLEQLFSGAQLKDSADLLGRIETLADLKIGEIKVPFSTAQYRLIKTWAERAGRTTQEMLASVIKDIKYELLNRVS